jgi:hypothetical protein
MLRIALQAGLLWFMFRASIGKPSFDSIRAIVEPQLGM